MRGLKQSVSAKKLRAPQGTRRDWTATPAPQLRKGDFLLVEAGDVIPADGEVIEGVASVDESAITGESAPVMRESGGDFSAVTGGTRVLSDWLVVRVTANPGEAFIDRMIAMVEGAKRQKTPNEIALTISAGRADDRVPAGDRDAAAVLAVQRGGGQARRAGHDHGADRAAGVPDPDHHRRPAVRHRRGRHEPHDAGQCDRHLGPRGRSGRRCRCVAARQDRHDHAGQPAGRGLHPAGGRHRTAAGRRRATGSLADETPEGRSIVVLAKQRFNLRERDLRELEATFVPFSAQTRMSGVNLGDARDAQRRGRRDARSISRRRASAFRRDVSQAVDEVARNGSTPLVVADGGRVLGVIELKDIVKGGIKERFGELRRMGIKTVMITGDNRLTAAAIAAEAGVDDFLAEATPEAKLKLIRQYQAEGRLVAMTGDGTNDAPALAQADVAVAMNSGTQAAKEAGNMVDLDSNPTKLIEIVEVGKQLLMTRGSLTTFSIANDVAKYFAIIPAAFATTYPQLAALDVMRLASPNSAILSAVIFNALIIVLLIPLALQGREIPRARRGIAAAPESA